MTRFFVPQEAPGQEPPADALADERSYQALRREAEACTGSICRERRIAEIECRYQGSDQRLRVGESNAANGLTVAAIVQLGRDTYTVHHALAAGGDAIPPMVLSRTEVYSVTDFD